MLRDEGLEHQDGGLDGRGGRIVGGLEAFALRHGRTMLELAFGWLLRDPVIASVIAGATSPEQIEQNVRAADWTPSAEDLAELDRIIGVLYELTERWFQPVVKLAYGNRARPGPAVADDAK